ncbi:MAG: SLBB domain-containing protein, partial [Armatimonadetes bacterium]|nr:SLBB domain-containing protein [Armatimonadota bacterium]
MPLGPGDVVSITVLDEPKLTGQFMVREDGKLNLPILGMVQVAGLTPTQLEDQLTKLCAKYIIKPVVSVMPVSAAPKVVSILGQVARPGTYDLRQCPTVLAMLAAAGGALPMANMAEAVLVRGKERIRLVPEGTKGAVPEDIPLKPGDAIFVPARVSAPVYVMGSVVKPGAQALEAATTASKAVILSGGPAPNADLRHAYILRGRDKVNVNLAPFLGSGRKGEQAKDVPLQPGDVVVLPQKVQRHVYVVGAVNTPGAEPIEEAQRVSQAIAMAGGLSDAADKANAYLIRGGERTKLDLAGLFDQGKVEADIQLEAGDAIVVPKRLPIFHIVGEVEKPGPYQLDQARSVLDAWSLVGKPLDDADLSHVVLLREGEKPRAI